MAKKPKLIKAEELFQLHNNVYSYTVNEHNEVILKIHRDKAKKEFVPPTLPEVQKYFSDEGYTGADDFYRYYSKASPAWHNSKGKPIRDWKATARQVWFEDSRKVTQPDRSDSSDSNKYAGVAF